MNDLNNGDNPYVTLPTDMVVVVQFLDANPHVAGSTPDPYPCNVWRRVDMGQFLPLDREEAHRVIQAIIKGRPVETYHSHFVPHAVRLLVCPKPVAAVEALLRFFAYAHLPPALQERSKPFHDLALKLVYGPQNDETVAALRKLLEAKDCAVRAWL